MMFVIPGTDKEIDDKDAPLEAIRKINAMVKSLINKVSSVKFGHWNRIPTKTDKLLTEFPEDLDITKRYIYNFNCFFSSGDRSYCRLKLYYKSITSLKKLSCYCRF